MKVNITHKNEIITTLPFLNIAFGYFTGTLFDRTGLWYKAGNCMVYFIKTDVMCWEQVEGQRLVKNYRQVSELNIEVIHV